MPTIQPPPMPDPRVQVLPPALQQEVRGGILAVVRPTSCHGLSSWGAKTVVITDRPAIYLHDAGGPLALPSIHCLELLQQMKASTLFVDQSREMRSEIVFESGAVAIVSIRDECERIADALFAGEACELPHVSATCAFQDDATLDLDALSEQQAAFVRCSRSPEGYFGAQVVPRDGRLELRTNGEVLLSVPLSHTRIERNGPRCLTIVSSVDLVGLRADVVSIFLPTSRMADHLWARIGSPGAGGVSSSSLALKKAHVVGSVDEGNTIDKELEIALDDDGFELLAPSGAASSEVLCRFDFGDDSLRWFATPEEFLVMNETAGPLAVRTDMAALIRRFGDDSRLPAVMRRTVAEGPFPIWLGVNAEPARLVACRLEGEAFSFTDRGDVHRVALGKCEEVRAELGSEGPQFVVKTESDTYTCRGSLALCQALYRQIREAHIRCAPAIHSPRWLRSAISREREYFSFALFGTLLECHRMLVEEFQQSEHPFAAALGIPENPERCVELAIQMAAGLEHAHGHLELVTLHFPSFVTERDARLFKRDGSVAPWLRKSERAYRVALGPIRHLCGEIRRLHDMLQKVTGPQALIDANQCGAADGWAAVLAAFNPLSALYELRNRQNRKDRARQVQAHRDEAARVTVERVIVLWNRIQFEMLPGVSRQVLGDLLECRSEVAAEYRAATEAGADDPRRVIRARMISRIARLESMLEFPAQPGDRHSCAQTVRALQERRAAFSSRGFLAF